MDNLIFREIQFLDINNGYLDLMENFSSYKKQVTSEEFNKYLETKQDHVKIYVVLDNNIIIAAASLFKLEKLHNNPVGQIEDVMVSEKYRKLGIGRKLINKLIDVSLNEMKCYKVILNCLEKNIEFYEKCGFRHVGVEMKYTI